MSDGRCQLCKNPTRYGAVLCWPHTDAIARMLDPRNTGDPTRDIPASIPVMFDMLDPTPGGGGDDSDRRAPGFASAPAASLHKLVMRDDRSINDPQVWYDPHPRGFGDDYTRPHLEEDAPPRPVRRAIEGIADALTEYLDPYQPAPEHLIGPRLTDDSFTTIRPVTDLCAWLYEHRDTITNHPAADDIHNDLLELTDQLRPAVGDRKDGPIGPCIVLVHDRHSREHRECGAQLYLPPPTLDKPGVTEDKRLRQLVITCPRCWQPYRWIDLMRLRYINQPDAVTA